MNRLFTAAIATFVIAIGVVFVGTALTSAQEGDEGSGPFGTFFSKLADKLGISEDELNTAVDEVQLEMVDEAVADGKISEERADELRERIAEADGPIFPFRGPKHFGFHPARVGLFENAAEVLGMTIEELRAALADEGSLAGVAEAQGVDAEQFKADLLAAIKEDLDAKVADETLTQEQADRIYEHLEENIDRIVEAEAPFGGWGRHHHRGPFGDLDDNGDATDDSGDQEETGVTA